MSQNSLEERVATLEKQMAQLLGSTENVKTKKDWSPTFGMFANDPEFDEVLRLGRDIRQQEAREENDDVGA